LPACVNSSGGVLPGVATLTVPFDLMLLGNNAASVDDVLDPPPAAALALRPEVPEEVQPLVIDRAAMAAAANAIRRLELMTGLLGGVMY
jgi:hypothetical protein